MLTCWDFGFCLPLLCAISDGRYNIYLTKNDMKLINIIIKGVFDCFTVWKYELANIRKDIGVIILFIVVPVAYPLLYGTIYTPETLHELPIVVVDESHSSLAREFIRKIDATPDVQIFNYSSSLEEAREIINKKQAYGLLHIPYDFSNRINRGEQGLVALYVDMSSMLYYKAFLIAATEASLDMGGKIHVQADMPVLQESVTFYNPQSGFASFLLPAILVLVIQQTLLLGIGMLTATTRERNKGRLVPPEAIYTGTFRVVIGKVFAYLTVYIFVCFWALIIVPHIFKIPQTSDYATLLLFSLPYLLACIFFAMMIATFIRGRETPMMVFVFTSLIFLFISGVSWPTSAMPDFWKYFGYLIPSTLGIQGFVKINSMGAYLWQVAFEYRMLWLQTGIYFIATCLIYRRYWKISGK
jgi:ABC-2 type transport system permease protein